MAETNGADYSDQLRLPPSASLARRLSALSRSVDKVRVRPRVDVRRALLFGGAIAMGLGFVAVVFGWYGASHSAYLFQEVPYLISGGLLGVALVTGGGFLFFAAWLARMIEDNRRHTERVARTLDQVDRTLIAIVNEANATATATFASQHANGGPKTMSAAGRESGHNGDRH